MEFLNAFSHLDWPLVLHLTWQHITLVGIAVTLAILVGVPLGILMTRFPTLAGPLASQRHGAADRAVDCPVRPAAAVLLEIRPGPGPDAGDHRGVSVLAAADHA